MRRCSSVSGDNNSDERGIIGGQWKGRNKRTYLYKSSCETSAQREEMLRVKYDSDPNVMAAALCDKSSEAYAKALEDYMFIEHDLTLSQWLHFLIDPPQQLQESSSSSSSSSSPGINKLIVLPMEKHFDQLIDGYILHLLQSM